MTRLFKKPVLPVYWLILGSRESSAKIFSLFFTWVTLPVSTCGCVYLCLCLCVFLENDKGSGTALSFMWCFNSLSSPKV